MKPKILKEYFAKPLWYLNPSEEINSFFINPPTDEQKSKEWYNARNAFLAAVSILLDQKEIALAEEGINLDLERKEIEAIVIHHTGRSSRDAADPISFINAMHMFTLYMKVFRDKNHELYKSPIWSNHFYKDHMTFIGYHYLVFRDGSVEQILRDEYIGWHCGNWEYNTKSIAVCFVDDLENAKPTAKAVQAAKRIIQKYKPKEILGHREIKSSTVCPGNVFLGTDGWKNKLL